MEIVEISVSYVYGGNEEYCVAAAGPTDRKIFSNITATYTLNTPLASYRSAQTFHSI